MGELRDWYEEQSRDRMGIHGLRLWLSRLMERLLYWDRCPRCWEKNRSLHAAWCPVENTPDPAQEEEDVPRA